MIDAYFHEWNGAVACNNARYLEPAYSINCSTVITFSFAEIMRYPTLIYNNLSFKCLHDPDGLRYLIGNFNSGKDDERAVVSSFLASVEFK